MRKPNCDARTIGPSDYTYDFRIKRIDCTSRSKEKWSLGLSPFHLGPVDLYWDYTAKNVENAWQFSKVYAQHVNLETGEPTDEYWSWAKKGWENDTPIRYPMGRGKVPEYSFWNGKKYGYIEARKKIYCPLYASKVLETVAYKKLTDMYNQHQQLYLFDFDGYDHILRGKSLQEVLDDKEMKMGHGFVLLMLLCGERLWEGSEEIKELDYHPAKPIGRKREEEPKASLYGNVKEVEVGFLILSEGEYFLLKYYSNESQRTIPKDVVSPEDHHQPLLEVAIRNLYLQTNIALLGNKHLKSLLPPPHTKPFQVLDNRKKKLVVYLLEDKEGLLKDKKKYTFVCQVLDGPSGKPKFHNPLWVSGQEARSQVIRTQQPLFQTTPSTEHSTEPLCEPYPTPSFTPEINNFIRM